MKTIYNQGYEDGCKACIAGVKKPPAEFNPALSQDECQDYLDGWWDGWLDTRDYPEAMAAVVFGMVI